MPPVAVGCNRLLGSLPRGRHCRLAFDRCSFLGLHDGSHSPLSETAERIRSTAQRTLRSGSRTRDTAPRRSSRTRRPTPERALSSTESGRSSSTSCGRAGCYERHASSARRARANLRVKCEGTPRATTRRQHVIRRVQCASWPAPAPSGEYVYAPTDSGQPCSPAGSR
jgi:hypothetical protein